MFYDFMTWFWGSLFGAGVAAFIVFLAGGGNRGIVLGVTGGVCTLAVVMIWRHLRRPQ